MHQLTASAVWGDKVICLICKQIIQCTRNLILNAVMRTNTSPVTSSWVFLCSPQSYAGTLNWHLIIKTLRIPEKRNQERKEQSTRVTDWHRGMLVETTPDRISRWIAMKFSTDNDVALRMSHDHHGDPLTSYLTPPSDQNLHVSNNLVWDQILTKPMTFLSANCV